VRLNLGTKAGPSRKWHRLIHTALGWATKVWRVQSNHFASYWDQREHYRTVTRLWHRVYWQMITGVWEQPAACQIRDATRCTISTRTMKIHLSGMWSFIAGLVAAADVSKASHSPRKSTTIHPPITRNIPETWIFRNTAVRTCNSAVMINTDNSSRLKGKRSLFNMAPEWLLSMVAHDVGSTAAILTRPRRYIIYRIFPRQWFHCTRTSCVYRICHHGYFLNWHA